MTKRNEIFLGVHGAPQKARVWWQLVARKQPKLTNKRSATLMIASLGFPYRWFRRPSLLGEELGVEFRGPSALLLRSVDDTQQMSEAEERVAVGGAGMYEARCGGCFVPHADAPTVHEE